MCRLPGEEWQSLCDYQVVLLTEILWLHLKSSTEKYLIQDSYIIRDEENLNKNKDGEKGYKYMGIYLCFC